MVGSGNSTPQGPTRRSECSYSPKSIFNSVTAGYAAGICGVVVGHPLDSIKVLLQTNPRGGQVAALTTAVAPATASRGLMSAGSPSTSAATPITAPQHASSASMSTVASNATSGTVLSASTGRSIRALYAGMLGPLLTVGLLQSAYFAIYDSTRRVLHRRDNPDAADDHYIYHDSLQNLVYASTVAGSLTTVLTSPLMVVKTKQQIMVWGFQKAITETIRAKPNQRLQSVRNFYVGFGPHFVAVTVGRCVYMTVYEVLKRSFVERRNNAAVDTSDRKPLEVTTPERMISAAVAGMACWAVIFPLDSVQNRMYQQALYGGQQTSWEMARDMYMSSGRSVRPFFRGIGLTVIRAGPVAAVVLPVYDMALEWLAKR